MHVQFANSDIDLARCFPIMVQLRPHLTQSEFINKVKQQQQANYSVVYLEEHGTIKAVAGFRVLEMLADGRHLYVDALIISSSIASLLHSRGRVYLRYLLATLVFG